MICREEEGEHKDGVPQHMFPEISFADSKCVATLKSAPQGEAPGQINAFSVGSVEVCFRLMYVSHPGSSSLPKTVSLR